MRAIFIIVTLFQFFSLLAQDFRDRALDLGVNDQYGTVLWQGSPGGGVTFFDFDKDGLEDLTFCSQLNQPLKFYKNDGSKFTPISFPGLVNYFETKQAVWVDVDNDDDYDLFVTAFGAPDLLYINDGAMNFANETVQRGLGIYYENSFGVDFSDINNDGFLDIYISNYDNLAGPISRNYLYLCDPSTLTYSDISIVSGADNGAKQTFCSVFLDYDFDGDQDFVLSNDRIYLNAFYENNGDSTFTEISATNGTNIQICSMNAGCGDFNNDGYWDLYHTNMAINPSALLAGSASGMFNDVSIASNTTFDRFGWAGNFFDYDNDEDLDLYVLSSSASPNAFYTNDGTGVFSEPFFNTGGLDGTDTLRSVSSAMADFDNNGLLDIAISKPLDPFSLYINYETDVGNWIKLDLRGVNANKDAIGSYVEVWINGSKRIFEKRVSNGFLNQHSNLMHIGIGAKQNVDSIKIRWPYPNSMETIMGPILPNMTYTVEEGLGIIGSIDYGICAYDVDVDILPIPMGKYTSSDSLSSASLVDSAYQVSFNAEMEVLLKPDFEVIRGADFEAKIDSCP